MSKFAVLLSGISVFLLLAAPIHAKSLYKWVDENGVTHFSDAEPESGAERVVPSGTTVIPMRDNISTQRRLEQIQRRPTPKRVQSSSPQTKSSGYDWEAYEKKREKERKQKQCQRYEDRIDWIDSRLRAGGYSNSTGNRLRAERRELSSKRSWECLRNN